MGLKEIFTITKQTRILLLILVCICLAAFLIAWIYYRSINLSEDPRVSDARIVLAGFDRLMKDRKYTEALHQLDSVEKAFLLTPGYRHSYESGVVFNNRGSAFLSMALYDSLSSPEEKENLLCLAEENVQQSIMVYEKWIDSAGHLTAEQIRHTLTPFFTGSDAAFQGRNIEKVIDKRVSDILEAQIETPRRLSVSYTNLGIIQRHQYRQEEAVKSYIEAIKLWKDNHTARNNFNVLMGRPPEDRSIIDKLFPPDRLRQK